MPDIAHYFSGDLALSATGDLLVADGALESQQRILRRLLTNLQDYLWQPEYGAGLPAFIGQPLDAAELTSLIRAQMYQEASVQQNPEPQISFKLIENGIYVQIQYVEAETGQTVPLTFTVQP